MAVGAAIAFAAFHLEDDDLFSAEEIFDGRSNFGTFDDRGTDVEFAVIAGDGENLIKNDFIARLDTEFFDFDDVTDLNFVLFSASLNNRMVIFVSILAVILCGSEPVEAISGVISSVGSVGPGLGGVASLENYSMQPEMSKLIFTFDMFLGRLEIFPVFIVISMIFKREK